MSAFPDLFSHLLVASRDATILALAIGGILLLAGNRLSPRWRHFLWLLVAVRLLTPVLPESHFSWQAWLPDSTFVSANPHPLEPTTNGDIGGALPENTAVPAPAASLSPSRSAPPSPDSILLLTWATGAVVGFGLLLLGWTRFHHAIRRTQLTESPFVRHLEEKTAQLASAWDMRPPRVVVSPAVHTPSVTGVFRKTFLFPSGFGENLDNTQLNYVILHELAHLKRRDTLVQWLLCILRIVHWFNPVIWWAFRRIRMESERATDELVLQRTSVSDRRAYGATLLRLVELSAQPRRVPGLIGVAENPGDIKSRVVAIARFRGRKAWRSALVSTLMLIGLATVGLTQAPSGAVSSPGVEEDRNTAPTEEPQGVKKFTGYLEPWRSVTVTWPEAEGPAEIHVEEGAEVTKGDPVASHDTSVLEGQLRIARVQAQSNADIAAAAADHMVALQRMGMLKTLTKRGTAHSSELARARASVETSQARLDRSREEKSIAELRVKEFEARISQGTLRSPIDGVVVAINHDTDLRPNEAGEKKAPLVRIAQVDKLALVMSISVKWMGDLKTGDDIRVFIFDPADRDTEVKGRLEFLSPEVDQVSGEIRVRISVPNEEGKLRSGSHASIHLPVPVD